MRLLIAAPFLIILVAFALSNRQEVALGLWPTDLSWQVPLSLAVLGCMGVAFLLGALIAWGGALSQRRRARRAEDTVRVLEAQVAELKARTPSLTRPRDAA